MVGIAGNQLDSLPIVTAAAYIETMSGPIIGIFNQYAYLKGGRTIHSVPQLEKYGVHVDAKWLSEGGTQCARVESYTIPLSISSALAYMKIRKPTEQEFQEHCHVNFTSDVPWNPSDFNNKYEAPDNFIFDATDDL